MLISSGKPAQEAALTWVNQNFNAWPGVWATTRETIRKPSFQPIDREHSAKTEIGGRLSTHVNRFGSWGGNA